MPLRRSAATKVMVFQCPCGTRPIRRSPRGQRPLNRTILVLAAVSSTNTSPAGSNMPCSRIQRLRARASSARSCSAARRLFFESDLVALEEAPHRGATARNFVLLVGFRKARGHRLEVEAVIAVGWFLQVGILELLQQERHSFEPVAAMAIAAVGEEADHCLVDLNAARRLRPVSGNCAFCALRRYRTWAIRNQEANENLQRPCFGLRWFLPSQSQEEHIRHAPAAESFLARNATQTAVLVVPCRDRGADHHAVKTQIPGQCLRGEARDPFAH